MKTFKNFLSETPIESNYEGSIADELPIVMHHTVNDVPRMGKPLASMGDLDLYQIHHGDPLVHSGHGAFIDTTENLEDAKKYGTYDGGVFIVHDRRSNKFVGHMTYANQFPHRPKDLNIFGLKSARSGTRGIRNFIYDNVSDKLGYTLISDTHHSGSGKRGWVKDIDAGKNVYIRYIKNYANEDWDEISAKGVPHVHIWGRITGSILHPFQPDSIFSKNLYPSDRVLLVRKPKGT